MNRFHIQTLCTGIFKFFFKFLGYRKFWKFAFYFLSKFPLKEKYGNVPSYSSSSRSSSSVIIFIKQSTSVALFWPWTAWSPGTCRVTKHKYFYWNWKCIFFELPLASGLMRGPSWPVAVFPIDALWTMSFLSPSCIPFKPAIAVSVICGSAYSQNA